MRNRWLSDMDGSKTARPRRRSGERPLPNRSASLPSEFSYRSDLMRESWMAAATEREHRVEVLKVAAADAAGREAANRLAPQTIFTISVSTARGTACRRGFG
jgi:hypothetical protein